MAKKVKTVLNPCGLRVKKCCASCANKYIENDGLRACPVIDEYVESGHVCKKWQMDYNPYSDLCDTFWEIVKRQI